jgi:hypothetical protein
MTPATDQEKNYLFLLCDGRFAFSCEHVDWAHLRMKERIKGL